MTAVAVSRLTSNTIDETFALVRLGYPDLTLAGWRSIAQRQLDHPTSIGGVLLARDAAQRLKGMVLYSLSICIAAKPCVQIERLVSFDVLNARAVADVLVTHVFELGYQHGCDSLSLIHRLDSPAITRALVLESDAAVLCQMV